MFSTSRSTPWKAFTAFLIKAKLFFYGAACAITITGSIQKMRTRTSPASSMQVHAEMLRKSWLTLVQTEKIPPSSLIYRTAISALNAIDGLVAAIPQRTYDEAPFASISTLDASRSGHGDIMVIDTTDQALNLLYEVADRLPEDQRQTFRGSLNALAESLHAVNAASSAGVHDSDRVPAAVT